MLRTLVLLGLATVGLLALWSRPLLVAGLGLMFGLWFLVERGRLRARLRRLAETREGDALEGFVKSLPIRELDTWVVRAVFEQVRNYLTEHPGFPLRASDQLVKDLRIDPDDLEDLAIEIAQRSGRVLDHCERNPYYNKVTTVEDIVRFFCAQPKIAA
jgi:hypothetical protein